MRRVVVSLFLSFALSACVMTKEEGDVLKRDVDKIKTELSAVQR
jgi:hypothetical protein